MILKFNITEYAQAVAIPDSVVHINGETITVYTEDDRPGVRAALARGLSGAKADVVAQIDAHASALRARVTAGSSPAEMSSWPLKLAEAQSSGAKPILQIEADARGVPLANIVARVLANAQAFMALEGAIAGTAGKHKDAVGALTSAEAVALYDWSTGWPL